MERIFMKYPSIENRYQYKFIQRFINYFPEIVNEEYIIYEKLHGSNISFVFTKGKFYICSRNRILENEENFNGCRDVITNKYLEFIEYWKEKSLIDLNKYTFFGEIVGKGIQKGVDYGEEKNIYFFDFAINDELMPQCYFMTITQECKCDVAPIIKVCSFEEMMNYTNEFDSMILGKENNICEGIVVKPYKKVIKFDNGSYFMLKSKNEKFSEKSKVKKNKQKDSNISENIVNLRIEFESYINENRVNNIFSKEGIINDVKDIGKYITLILNDAKEDFEKDFDISDIDKKDQKYIFNCSHLIVKILKNNM